FQCTPSTRCSGSLADETGFGGLAHPLPSNPVAGPPSSSGKDALGGCQYHKWNYTVLQLTARQLLFDTCSYLISAARSVMRLVKKNYHKGWDRCPISLKSPI